MSRSKKPSKGSKKGPKKGPKKRTKKGPVDPKHRKNDERTIGPSKLQKDTRKVLGILNSERAKKRREEKEQREQR